MLKLTGALLVILACSALALKHINKKRYMLLALGEMAETLKSIAQAIGFQLEPLPHIVETLSREQEDKPGAFIQHLKRYIQNNNLPFSAVWQRALCDFYNENTLPQQAKTILEDVGMHLGKADATTEESRLLSAAEHITTLCKTIEKEHQKTEKMTQSLGVILGIFIVILLL